MGKGFGVVRGDNNRGGLIGKGKQANTGTGEVGELFLIQLSSANAPEVSDWECFFSLLLIARLTMLSLSLILIVLHKDEEGKRGNTPAETRSCNGSGG